MATKTLTMLGVGDIMLHGKESPDEIFELAAPVLKSADIVIGQVELPHTSRPHITCAVGGGWESRPAVIADPIVLEALKPAGFNVITLASNHLWDAGIPGVEDTIAKLRDLGMITVGTGMNIEEARRPAIIKRKGTRIGFLNYNCVGPKETWANEHKPGCAYVQVFTIYEMVNPGPGEAPTGTYTVAELGSLQAMVDDIQKLRPLCDVLVVKFHKGMGFVQAKLAQYEQQVSYAAIDAGADLVLAEHAHILKGIEQYKGKTIFHGLCHFALGFRGGSFRSDPVHLKKEINRFKEYYGIEANPESMKHGYNTLDAYKTIVAKCVISNGQIVKTSYLPCLINKENQPEILKHDKRGQELFDYMDMITREAGLNAQYEWEGDEVVIHS